MAKEKNFWTNCVKKNVKGHWTRIESGVGSGVPDCIALVDGVTSWVELKDKERLMPRLGCSKLQVYWMRRWCLLGGNAFLLARACREEHVFLIWGADVGNVLSLEGWQERAVVYARGTGNFDWGKVADMMRKNTSNFTVEPTVARGRFFPQE